MNAEARPALAGMTRSESAAKLDDRRILHLGSGLHYREDAVNVDVTQRTNPDVVHNLNVRPWPFPENRFDTILAHDVIEHLEDIVGTMEEVHRVGKPRGMINITVPHFSSYGAFTDPTHRHYFGRFTFDYFCQDHPLAFYGMCRFRVISAMLIFHPTLLNKFIWRLANRFPQLYERRWAWILPAWFIWVRLQIVK
jgi:SAM-dependent methyltransferase